VRRHVTKRKQRDSRPAETLTPTPEGPSPTWQKEKEIGHRQARRITSLVESYT